MRSFCEDLTQIYDFLGNFALESLFNSIDETRFYFHNSLIYSLL